jgi:hypothetical protein
VKTNPQGSEDVWNHGIWTRMPRVEKLLRGTDGGFVTIPPSWNKPGTGVLRVVPERDLKG